MKFPDILSGHSPHASSPAPEKVTLDRTENSLSTQVTKKLKFATFLKSTFSKKKTKATTMPNTHKVHSKYFKLQNNSSLIKSLV